MAHPVSRRALFWGRVLAFVAATFGILIIGWLGLGFAVLASIYGILLDRDWGHLKYLFIVPLWVPYSVFIDLVIVWSFVLEIRGARAEWHKITRRGAA